MNLRRGHPGRLPPPDDRFLERLPPGDRRLLDEMLSVSVVGSPETVRRGLEAIVARTGADELMLTSQIYDHERAPALLRAGGRGHDRRGTTERLTDSVPHFRICSHST